MEFCVIARSFGIHNSERLQMPAKAFAVFFYCKVIEIMIIFSGKMLLKIGGNLWSLKDLKMIML